MIKLARGLLTAKQKPTTIIIVTQQRKDTGTKPRPRCSGVCVPCQSGAVDVTTRSATSLECVHNARKAAKQMGEGDTREGGKGGRPASGKTTQKHTHTQTGDGCSQRRGKGEDAK